MLVVITKADGLPELGAAGARDDVRSAIEPLRRRAFDRVVGALGAKVRRVPCVVVAAEAVLDARPESSALADHFHATIAAPEARFEGARAVVIARREALRLRAGVAVLSRAQTREEDLSRKRLAGLESKRIPDPAEFRRQLLDRLDGSIEQGADHALATAIDGLHAAIERLRSEWKERISSSSARGEVDACIAVIDESAPGRITAALEQTAEIVARELHEVTERLQGWAIEEIHSHYRLVRRLGAEALAPVASELTREDLEQELMGTQPFGSAMDAFEKQRVGLGLGGVAAGAALGTLIAPGIGTAVGAVLGVLAGLLKGTDSLKQECIAKIDARLNETESHARSQLKGKQGRRVTGDPRRPRRGPRRGFRSAERGDRAAHDGRAQRHRPRAREACGDCRRAPGARRARCAPCAACRARAGRRGPGRFPGSPAAPRHFSKSVSCRMFALVRRGARAGCSGSSAILSGARATSDASVSVSLADLSSR